MYILHPLLCVLLLSCVLVELTRLSIISLLVLLFLLMFFGCISRVPVLFLLLFSCCPVIAPRPHLPRFHRPLLMSLHALNMSMCSGMGAPFVTEDSPYLLAGSLSSSLVPIPETLPCLSPIIVHIPSCLQVLYFLI